MEIDPPLPESIVVTGDIPASPQVLVDESFVKHLVACENTVRELIIAAPEQQARAGLLLNELTKAATKLETARETLKKPYLEWGRRIDAIALTVSSQISAVKASLNGKMRQYQMEVDRIAREEEQKRQATQRAELKRLEDLRAAEEKKAREEAERIRAAQPKIQQMDFDVPAEPTPIEQKIAAVQSAPAIVAPPKPAGVKWTVSLKFEVLDVTRLPAEYVIPTANLPKLRGLTAGWKEGQPIPVVPGTRFYEDRQFQGTGR